MSKGNKQISHSAKCPFYKKHFPTQIICQGFSGVYSVSMNLLAKEAVSSQLAEYCCSKNWRKCLYARAKILAEEEGKKDD